MYRHDVSGDSFLPHPAGESMNPIIVSVTIQYCTRRYDRG